MLITGFDNHNQSIPIKELFEQINKSVSSFLKDLQIYKDNKIVYSETIKCLKEIHLIKAEVDSVRDAVDIYYINDILEDEKNLSIFAQYLDNVADEVEKILEKNEILSSKIKETLYDALDDLHSSAVNASFEISQKIAQAYLDNKSNIQLLKEA